VFAVLLFLAAAAALWATPAHGPRHGYLIINGGGDYSRDVPRLIQMAGGPNARIVVIPTASITQPLAPEALPRFCSAPANFSSVHCTVLHTTDRAVADSEEFVKPLKNATGVWIVGGRQWRLADAYLNTRTERELFALLDRGGVIGGGSAGATIQGSFLVRGQAHPDDNHVMIATDGHTVGFGFVTNVAIDQHVDARQRENDLAVVIQAHPELLGIGLDQGTSITVHGDEFVVNGPHRVAVWDGKDHDGKGYYYLHTGDRFDLVTRVATLAPESVAH
jgi:cyanophycinase